MTTWAGRIEARLADRIGPSRLAVLAMAGAMALWVTIESLGGLVMPAMSPLQLVWARYASHLLLMIVFLAPKDGFGFARTRRPIVQLGRSLLMLGMPMAWIAAGARMPMATVMSVFWIAPFVALIVAALALKERPRGRTVLLVGIGYAGILLLFRPELPSRIDGPLLAVAMASCFAVYLVVTRFLRDESTQTNLFYSALGVFLALLPVLPAIWRPVPASSWIVVLAIGGLGYAFLFLIDRMLHLADLDTVAPMAFAQPIFEVMLYLGGKLSILSLIQLAGILLATAVCGLTLARRNARIPGAIA